MSDAKVLEEVWNKLDPDGNPLLQGHVGRTAHAWTKDNIISLKLS